ncbi:CoA transferase [Piscinibacter sakaiensis]|nr:CoA transferase [Piscinibacter sakaiensis]
MPSLPPSPANAPDAGAAATLARLWHDADGAPDALDTVDLPGDGPVLPSSFAVATAAQASLAAATLAAAELWHGRHPQRARQRVRVDRRAAALACAGHALIDGVQPPQWDPLSGLYACGADAGAPGHVRVHANFAHHRDGALALLGLPPGPDTPREAVAAALRGWTAPAFEEAAAARGLVVAAARRFDEWDAHPQAAALAAQPVVAFERLGEAPPRRRAPVDAATPPLAGLRVLEMTRILAGPVAGRTLAAHGAEVLLVNGPHLPNIAAIADTSRGKRSAHVDLRTAEGRATLERLLAGADVFLQGYRPGALAARGFDAAGLARRHPGLVCVSLSAYGEDGPWGGRRGFDSLVQTATGFNHAEAEAAGGGAPRAMPVQILDYAAGHLLAFGAAVALARQAQEGGSWLVRVSLAGVGRWLRGLGRVPGGLAAVAPDPAPWMETTASGFGTLTAMRHAGELSLTPPGWTLPSMPPGSHPAEWLGE